MTDQVSSVNNKNHDQANLFRDQKISDSAFYYYSIAKDEYLSGKNGVKAAQALINMAIIQCDNGDYFGSIETSLEADTLLPKKNDKMAAGFLAAALAGTAATALVAFDVVAVAAFFTVLTASSAFFSIFLA
jgi:hypothetical protein